MAIHKGGRGPGHMARVQGVATPLPLAISGTAPAAWQNAPGYSFTPTVTGGSGTRSFARTGSALPTGLSFSTVTGAITGTPTAIANTTGIIITVTDSTGSQAVTVSINVVAQLTISGSPATTGTQGSAYSFTPTVGGGVGTKLYTITGTPPPGVSLNSTTGVFSGTPTLAGTATGLIIRVTDDVGTVSLASFNLAIASNLALSGTPGTATNGSPYTFTPTTTGGTAPYVSYALTNSLPTGLSFSTSTGAITGTPTVNGTTPSLNITVTDSVGSTASLGAFSLVVNSPGAAPVNVSVPVITGTAQVGQTLTASTGSWNNSPSSYAYQWKVGGTNAGTNANTYVPVTGDIGSTITCTVTATNGFGSASATSSATAAVIAASVMGPVMTSNIPPPHELNVAGAAETYIRGYLRVTGGLTSIQLAIPLYCDNSNLNDGPLSGTLTAEGAYEYPTGTFNRITFGGSNSGSAAGAVDYLTSDEMSISTIPNGTLLGIWVLVTGTSLPRTYPAGAVCLLSDEAYRETAAGSANHTPRSPATDATFTDTNSRQKGLHFLVLGRTNDQTIGIHGDSLNVYPGKGADRYRGDIEKIVGDTYAYINLAVAGDSWTNSLWGSKARRIASAYCTHEIDAMGVNSVKVKGDSAANTTAWHQRAAMFSKGRKRIVTKISPFNTPPKVVTLTGSSISGSTLTLGTGTGLTVGMKLNVTGSPYITGKLSGTNYGDPGSTYSLSSSTGNGLTPTTATGQFMDPAGGDQTTGTSNANGVTYNSGLAAALSGCGIFDRAASTESTTPGTWYGDGTTPNLMVSSADTTHYTAAAISRIVSGQQSAVLSAITSATAYAGSQPKYAFDEVSQAFSGGYATGGTFTRNDIMAFTNFRLMFTVNTSAASWSIVTAQSATAAPIKSMGISASGFITVTNASAVTITGTTDLRTSTDRTVEICFDYTNIYVFIDGVFEVSGSNGLTAGTRPFLQFTPGGATKKIKEITLWNSCPYTSGTHTVSTAYIGNEAATSDLIVRWPMDSAGHVIAGGALPT